MILEDKVAIVTGAGTGIGEAIVDPDVVWATPLSAVSALQFDGCRVVYDLSAGASAPAAGDTPLFRAHERLLGGAARVVKRPKRAATRPEDPAGIVVETLAGVARTLPRSKAKVPGKSASCD